MNIHQIQISYSDQEDRLLMSINSTENEEMRLFLTRRIVTSFLDILNQTISHSLLNKPELNNMEKSACEPDKELTPQQMQQQMAHQAKHQHIVDESDYATPFNTGNKFPMGEVPILVVKITINIHQDNNVSFVFVNTDGEDINFNLNPQLLHNILDLLAKVLPSTEWNIGLLDKNNLLIAESEKNLILH
ncbi:hypothetical protein [Bathymodiolus septemdierum thioautotrophic gill symbiont]|uniref:Uncharacterized protein n=1 Tax=endosymbiont of Bathymodiolus septemdierum str. Myojin knoll TaxID=1303921 RepID=A0A0P0UTE1_9GAMM|nr:hypothetical protein [Bathymodiolus septemdierum thioautotrophic gill symbiont]BAS68219.1 hypothetical protein BSEPE_1233 [endosymbiont of Bathymodiolus septemdierum str. Myojin knoll]